MSSLQLNTNDLTTNPEEHNSGKLSSANTYWIFGEWDKLTSLNLEELKHHPERGRIALLIASAHQQLGNHNETREFIRKALTWDCPTSLIAKVLVAGVHNTLGRASAIRKDNERTKYHFTKAINIAADNDHETNLVSHARSVREMTRLGLLPQAASLVDEELQTFSSSVERPDNKEARIKVIETEIELLNYELSQSLQRNQLYNYRNNAGPIEPDPENPEWIKELKTHSVSQLGQDIWVLEQTNYKRNGFFVEFGASDGVLLSNTFLLEKEFEWEGICSEPNPKFFNQLIRNRNCIVSDACIGSKTGEEIEFILANEYGGMAKHAKNDNCAERRSGYLALDNRRIFLETVSLHDFLIHWNAPKYIDYMSIDTEGSEYEILTMFPFEKWRVKLITVEHNFTENRMKIRELLKNNGYVCFEHEWDDWYIFDPV